MADLSELADDIDEQAAKPQAVTADGVSVQSRSLKDLDDHYDRVASREAARAGRSGITFTRLKMPGAADGC